MFGVMNLHVMDWISGQQLFPLWIISQQTHFHHSSGLLCGPQTDWPTVPLAHQPTCPSLPSLTLSHLSLLNPPTFGATQYNKHNTLTLMEVAVELEDDLFFADLSKQISLLIMDEDEDPLASSPQENHFQVFPTSSLG